MAILRNAVFVPVLMLLVGHTAQSQTVYKTLPILKAGETVGTVPLRPSSTFFGTAINDAGQVAFFAQDQKGGVPLLLANGGAVTAITVGGGQAPGDALWLEKSDLSDLYQVSMNRHGSLVFATLVKVGNRTVARNFLRDAASGTLVPIVLPGLPAGDDLTLNEGTTGAINSRGEIAFFGLGASASGGARDGVFFRSPDGALTRVVITGDALPGGGTVQRALWPSLNDEGRVAFIASRKEDAQVGQGKPELAYLWEKGVLSPTVPLGAEAPGGRKIAHVWYVYVNNKNRNVLLQAILDKPWTGPHGLYLLRDGQLVAVATPGQEMPGGGQLQRVRPEGTSAPNDLGQHAFVAEVREEGRLHTALYLMDADGTVSLVLKSGAVTELGTITRVGSSTSPARYVALNGKGQIALPLKLDGVPEMLALITPATQ
jgi:hypothetical protein